MSERMDHLVDFVMGKGEKLAVTAIKNTQRLPRFIQQGMSKMIGGNPDYANIDPAIKLLLTARQIQGAVGLVSKDPIKSRRFFKRSMQAVAGTPTPVGKISDMTITANELPLRLRHYKSNTAPNNTLPPLLIYIHGGGFVVGDLDTYNEPCRMFCHHGQMDVLSVEYRLAPEAQAPAQIEDCVSATIWAFENAEELGIDPTKICIGGDSAGGYLATMVAQRLTEHYPLVAQLLIYPVTDSINEDYPSLQTYAEGLFLTRKDLHCAKCHYLGISCQLKPCIPETLSPIYGNLKQLAPAILVTAEFDVLRDEGEAYGHKLQENGTPCEMTRVLGQCHGFLNMTAINDNASQATINMAHALNRLVIGE